MTDESHKPAIFYHGSLVKDVEEFEPRAEHVRDPKEGPVVFASPEIAYATMFILPDTAEMGYFNDVPYVVILNDRDAFIKNDRGGYVYELSSDTFEYDSEKGMEGKEWTSRVPVKSIRATFYPSSLDAAIEQGVQIYFVDARIHASILESSDHALEILRNLESENQRRGVNVRPF